MPLGRRRPLARDAASEPWPINVVTRRQPPAVRHHGSIPPALSTELPDLGRGEARASPASDPCVGPARRRHDPSWAAQRASTRWAPAGESLRCRVLPIRATGRDGREPRMPDAELSPEQVNATIQSRSFLVLLVVAAIVGVVVSLGAWCFLELVNQIQQGVFVHLPSDLGYHTGDLPWWSLPVLAIAGLIVAFAIVRLPGNGGHIPANGLVTTGGPTMPIALPGIALAAMATIGLGNRARPRGAADRARLGSRGPDHAPCATRNAPPGADA